MNIQTKRRPRKRRLAYLLAALSIASAATAHAGQPCALYDGDPATEQDGGSTAIGSDAMSAVGTGYQGGQAALAVSYQRLIDEKSTFTIGGTCGGHSQCGAGAAFGFGW